MLYPLGKLDRVALEFDRRDLSQKFLQPPQPNGITPTLGCLVTAFRVFGPPRQLLLVRGAAGYEGDDEEAGLVCGWERMGFVDCNSENGRVRRITRMGRGLMGIGMSLQLTL